MEKLKALAVKVDKVKPLELGGVYKSRMILDHVISGRDGVIQMNHGTVAPRSKLSGDLHKEDEIYYILSGNGKLQLDDKVIDVSANQVIFIPAGVFHRLDNSDSDEELTLLTMWKDYRFNDTYEYRVKLWGKSFKTIDEE